MLFSFDTLTNISVCKKKCLPKDNCSRFFLYLPVLLVPSGSSSGCIIQLFMQIIMYLYCRNIIALYLV